MKLKNWGFETKLYRFGNKHLLRMWFTYRRELTGSCPVALLSFLTVLPLFFMIVYSPVASLSDHSAQI